MKSFARSLLAAALVAVGCAMAPGTRTPEVHRFDRNAERIEAEATRLMAAAKVNGLAMAVIDLGEVAFTRAWGRRNVERDLPLQADTIMYGASLTKFPFANTVLQLVDEGKIDLLARASSSCSSCSRPAAFQDARPPGMMAIKSSAGLGVVTFEGPFGRAFFKGGHNDSTGNQAICVEKDRCCVLLMSNDVRAESIFQRLTDATLGDPGMPWSWESYVPTTDNVIRNESVNATGRARVFDLTCSQ